MKTSSEQETMAQGAKLAQTLAPGSVVALVGELGSGKTTFVKGLAKGLNVPSLVGISSPTFVLVHEYRGGRLPLFHFDFYRLAKAAEARHLDLEEYWEGNGISVVEWADRFAEIFPSHTQWIHFRFVNERAREIVVSRQGSVVRKN